MNIIVEYRWLIYKHCVNKVIMFSWYKDAYHYTATHKIIEKIV